MTSSPPNASLSKRLKNRAEVRSKGGGKKTKECPSLPKHHTAFNLHFRERKVKFHPLAQRLSDHNHTSSRQRCTTLATMGAACQAHQAAPDCLLSPPSAGTVTAALQTYQPKGKLCPRRGCNNEKPLQKARSDTKCYQGQGSSPTPRVQERRAPSPWTLCPCDVLRAPA